MTHDVTPIHIDGSQGEGGGQVLRSALSLSTITGQPVRITNIRANRPKPGLMAQHLKSVDAAAAVSKAEVIGASLYSQIIEFYPSQIRSGRYQWDIQTAGSTSLVLQTIFYPLSLANSASTVIITGGTHVSWSPCFHYLAMHWMPYLRQMGFEFQLTLDQPGFYPRGGGRITANIRPSRKILPIHLTQRGKLLQITGISAVASLKRSIAERQKRQALLRLQALPIWPAQPKIQIKIEELPSPHPGTFVILLAEFEGGRCCYSSLGELGKPAERVADQAVDALIKFVETDAAIDQYLADQLLLPASLAEGPSQFRTCQVTQHLQTNAIVLRAFSQAQIDIQGELGQPGLITVMPTSTNYEP